MSGKRGGKSAKGETQAPRTRVRGIECHRGKWRWRQMVDGVRTTVPLAARSEEEAIAEVQRLQDQRPGTISDGWEVAVAAYLAAGRGARKLSESTAETRGLVLVAAGREMGWKTPRHATEAAVRRWVEGLEGRMKAASVRDYVAHLRAFARWCVDARRMSEDPLAGVVLPPVEDNSRDVFVEAEGVARLLAAARAAGDRDMEWIIALGCECGMRRGEIAACRAGWFDLARGSVTIPVEEAKPGLEGQTWKRKGRAGRRRAATVPLSAAMLEMIGHHGLPEPFVVAPKKATWGKSRYRFEFRRRFEAFMAAQGMPEVTIHDLRRSFGSNRVSAGVSIEKVANWMGIHRNTAWARYARFIPADAEINRGGAGEKRPAARVAAPAGKEDAAERLRKVEGLFAAGLITEEERQAKREEILRDL